MKLNILFASVSTAALLASPLAAQNASGSGSEIDRSGTPGEQVVQQGGDTVVNPETTAVDESKSDNMRAGAPQESTAANSAMDSTFTVETVDSIDATLSESMMDSSSPWVGKSVTSIDGTPLGTVAGVYTGDSGMSYAEVTLDDKLGIDADSFLIGMAADTDSSMDGIQLPHTQVEFSAELQKKAGLTPGAGADKSDG